jgi:hypothetical protein
MTKPVEARDLSGLWDPQAEAVPVQPDFERLRRLARLGPDDPGYNPMALTLAEIDQQERDWLQQQQQQQQ